MNSIQVKSFFDPATFTFSHVVTDPATRQCALIDPVLDYESAAGRISHHSADQLMNYVRQHQLQVQWVLDTHVHADHLSAMAYVHQALGGITGIGVQVVQVQEVFGELFQAEPEFARNGSQFQHLFQDGEVFKIGQVEAQALHTPGHTPACMSYVIGDAVFVGDTLFMPDYGTARCDFPGGNATTLYHSVQKLYGLPDSTQMFLCHDYKAPGRDEFCAETTVGAQRQGNVHIHTGVSEADFVSQRTQRDAGLKVPALLLPSVQVNMRGGHLPPAKENGISYLSIPLNQL